MNTTFQLVSYFIAFSSLLSALRVLYEDPAVKMNRAFFILAMSCFWYSLFYGLMAGEADPVKVRLYYRISSLGWATLPTATFLFVNHLSSYVNDRIPGYYRYIAPIPMLIFIPAGISGKLLAQSFERTPLGWMESRLLSGPLDWLYMAVVTGLMLYAVSVLFRLRGKVRTKKGKSLILWTALPLVLAGILSLVTNLFFGLLPEIKFPALGHIWFGSSVIIIGISVLKFRFFEEFPVLVTGEILELMTDICIITDKKQKIVDISQAGQDFWGIRFSKEKIRQPEPLDLSILLGMTIPSPGTEETQSGIIEIPGKDGTPVPHQYVLKSFTDRFDELLGFFFIARNIEELKNLEKKTGRLKGINERLKDLSESDALTGIYNRLKFNQRMEKECRKSQRYHQPLSLIMIDLDDFKKVNDRHGHEMGDKVLVGVCRAIEPVLRDVDTFARWGGEEFMVLCPGTDINGAFNLAVRLKSEIQSLIIDSVTGITASFGLTQYSEGEKKSDLLGRTDDHLYKAKDLGKNTIVYK